MKKILFMLLLLCTIMLTHSESMATSLGKTTIIGKLVDADNNSPVEYASVALYNQNDASLVTGGLTPGIFLRVGKKTSGSGEFCAASVTAPTAISAVPTAIRKSGFRREKEKSASAAPNAGRIL